MMIASVGARGTGRLVIGSDVPFRGFTVKGATVAWCARIMRACDCGEFVADCTRGDVVVTGVAAGATDVVLAEEMTSMIQFSKIRH